MSLPNNKLLDVVELKQAIVDGDLNQKSGSVLPVDSPLCPDFEEMGVFVDLDTSTYVSDGYSLDRCATLGKLEFQNFINLVAGWLGDITAYTYSGHSLSVASEVSHPVGVCISNDGNKLFVADTSGAIVHQYTLTTPYTLAGGGTFDGETYIFEAYGGQIRSVFMNPADDSKIFITDGHAKIHEYSCLNDNVILGATFVETNQITGAEGNYGTSMKVTADGSLLYKIYHNGSTRIVYCFSLTTPWNFSAYTENVGSLNLSSLSLMGIYDGLSISPDGSKLYITAIKNGTQGIIAQYTLTIPGDLTTAVYDGFLDTGDQSDYPMSCCLSDDGSKLWLATDFTDSVYEFSI